MNSRHKAGGVAAFRPADFNQYSAELKELAQRVNWERGGDENTDRIADTWLPLLAVDAFLGGDWGQFAEQQMERARANLRLGHEEEPTQAVYRAFLALALQNEVLGPEERVLVADITRNVQDGLQLNSWQVGKLLRDMRFKTDTAGGKQYAYTGGSAMLVKAGLMLGVQDQWIEQELRKSAGPD